MKIKMIILGSALLCAPIYASSQLTKQLAKLNLEETPVSAVNLESHPINVSLFTNGTAVASVSIGNTVYITERSVFKKVIKSPQLSVDQMLLMCEAIETAFKASRFRGDRKEVKNFAGELHSQWKVQLKQAVSIE